MTKSSIVLRGLLLLLSLNIGSHLDLAAQGSFELSAHDSYETDGLIVDRLGIGIPDASILVENDSRKWEFRSSRNGEFRLAVPLGHYKFTFERAGFKKLVVADVVINGMVFSQKFRMDIDCCMDVVFIRPAHLYRPQPTAPNPEPNIGVNGYYANDKAQRGRTVQAAIVMEIPSGYHVNSNRPLGKYAIATSLKIEAPRGITVGPVTYPRAIVRKLKANNNEALAVYEGRAILRFNVVVPASYQGGEVVLKARLRYQSCNDEVCFPPKSQDVDMGIGVVGPNDRVQRANGWVFGGR